MSLGVLLRIALLGSRNFLPPESYRAYYTDLCNIGKPHHKNHNTKRFHGQFQCPRGLGIYFLSCLPVLRVFIVVEHPVLPDGKIFIFPVCAATVFTGRYALALFSASGYIAVRNFSVFSDCVVPCVLVKFRINNFPAAPRASAPNGSFHVSSSFFVFFNWRPHSGQGMISARLSFTLVLPPPAGPRR